VSRTYEVTHRTVYSYDDDVSGSYGRAYLTPRDAMHQWCLSSKVEVSPQPDLLSDCEDFFGNRSVYVEVHTPHRELAVVSRSRVAVSRPAMSLADLASASGWAWEAARDAVHEWAGQEDVVQARGFLLESPQVTFAPQVRAYAGEVFTPGRRVGESVAELVGRIHGDFAYKAGVTSVTSTLAEVLAARKGVCQDFAHLAVACLRSVGLPARYVSGYLETRPPPGKPKLQGADASHAWAAVLLPELGWVDVDPTNNRVIDDSYVVTAWGRDYTDVPPLKGVIFTESTKSTLRVAVDVVPVPS
jgi:transglutaminase-like putative cysteine protease